MIRNRGLEIRTPVCCVLIYASLPPGHYFALINSPTLPRLYPSDPFLQIDNAMVHLTEHVLKQLQRYFARQNAGRNWRQALYMFLRSRQYDADLSQHEQMTQVQGSVLDRCLRPVGITSIILIMP